MAPRRTSISIATGIVSLGSLVSLPEALHAAEARAVRVVVADGREFSGWVDARSTDKRLWLRSECGGAYLTRPITWEAVRRVTSGSQAFSVDEFRAQLGHWTTPTPESRCGEPVEAPKPGPRAAVDPSAAMESNPVQVVNRVQSIQLDAGLANWDNDVEDDGLIVTVVPLDRNGNVVAVDGALEVELIGEGPGTTAALSTFPLLGRWVQPIRAAEMTANGVQVRLEFQAAHPEFDLRLGTAGLVHGRLTVPGHGTFEATTGATTLRPYNPIRDRLQQQTRQRFFPNEQTGIGKRATLPVNER